MSVELMKNDVVAGGTLPLPLDTIPSNGKSSDLSRTGSPPMEKPMKKGRQRTFKVLTLPIETIIIEKGSNPRLVFDTAQLEAMASSLKHVGLMNPLTVRKKKDTYYLVAGERRLRAAKLAGFKEVPVKVEAYTDGQATYARFSENAYQVRLNPIEMALSIQSMIGQTVERPTSPGKEAQPEVVNAKIAAEIANISQAKVSQYLALLTLPKAIQDDIRAEKVTFTQARTLCDAKDPALQLKIYQKIKAGDVKRASDVKEVLEKMREKSEKEDKKKGGRSKEKTEGSSTAGGNAIERLQNAKLSVRQVKEVRDGLLQAYEVSERAKKQDRKIYYKGIIAAMEWMTGLRDTF